MTLTVTCNGQDCIINDGVSLHLFTLLETRRKNKLVCTVTDPKQLDGLIIEVAGQKTFRASNQRRTLLPAAIFPEKGHIKLSLDLDFCRFIIPTLPAE